MTKYSLVSVLLNITTILYNAIKFLYLRGEFVGTLSAVNGLKKIFF